MNTINLKNDLINQINLLSEEQLKTVMAFVNNLYQQHLPIQDNQTTKQEERMALAEKFNQLCEDTQNLFIDNPITEEEIQAEIDAYRRGE
jgi:DeoR/GlpR family transcriptional regulator of sugar metabolism